MAMKRQSTSDAADSVTLPALSQPATSSKKQRDAAADAADPAGREDDGAAPETGDAPGSEAREAGDAPGAGSKAATVVTVPEAARDEAGDEDAAPDSGAEPPLSAEARANRNIRDLLHAFWNLHEQETPARETRLLAAAERESREAAEMWAFSDLFTDFSDLEDFWRLPGNAASNWSIP